MIFKICMMIASIVAVGIPRWTVQTSGVTVRLRGVSAVSERVAWASGAGSTVLRTTDGGAAWQKIAVTSDALDFRDIDAVDAQTAYVLAIGNGPASRIYKTTDAGKTWTMQFRNEDPKAFLDAMSFWDANNGIVFGDSVDGQLYIMTTRDGGRVWSRVPTAKLPPALENEGAFAASGTNIAVFGKSHAWIGTGAAAKARVLRTSDGGRTWQAANTPLAAGPSSGIFSIAFRDANHGVIAGGDYRKEQEAVDNLAVTNDGGVTWNDISPRLGMTYDLFGTGKSVARASYSLYFGQRDTGELASEMVAIDAFDDRLGNAVGVQRRRGSPRMTRSRGPRRRWPLIPAR